MPRNDYLLNNQDNTSTCERLNTSFGLNNKPTKIILYAPTYREVPKENELILHKILSEFDNVDPLLKKQDYYILFRPHYFHDGIGKLFKKYSNIKYAGNDIYNDVRDLMIYSDLLVTDYSSIFVDYLLLERPIIFYPFDLEKYKETRGLINNFDNTIETPGPSIVSIKELAYLNKLSLKNYNLNTSKHYYHKYPDNHSCERIVSFIVNTLM